MDWPRYVRSQFWTYVNSRTDLNPNLITSLKTSDRTNSFLTNLSEEISKAERVVHRRRRKPLKKNTIRETIHEMARLLLRGIESEAQRMVESDISRLARKERSDYLDDLDKTTDGTPSGIFEELEIQDVYREEDGPPVKVQS